MNKWTHTFSILILALTFTTAAFALDLEEARSKKLIEELPTGYIKAVDGAAKGLADEINKKRKMTYEEIAKKNNIPVDQVATQAAKKIEEKLKGSGH